MECTAAFENLENKNKKVKLNPNAPLSTLPCKIAHTCNTNENEVIHKFKHSKTTAIFVQPASKTAHLRGAPQVLPTWRGLLDSGSKGDLLFIKKEPKITFCMMFVQFRRLGTHHSEFITPISMHK